MSHPVTDRLVVIGVSYQVATALNNAVRREIEIVERRRERLPERVDLTEYQRLLEEARDEIAAACGASS